MVLFIFMATSNLPEHLFNWITNFNLLPIRVMTFLVIICIIIGALMDETSTQLLTIPFYPLIVKLGFDPIWFGALQARLLQIGMISPPVGINGFVIGGFDKTAPLTTVYKGVIPFLFMDMIHWQSL